MRQDLIRQLHKVIKLLDEINVPDGIDPVGFVDSRRDSASHDLYMAVERLEEDEKSGVY